MSIRAHSYVLFGQLEKVVSLLLLRSSWEIFEACLIYFILSPLNFVNCSDYRVVTAVPSSFYTFNRQITNTFSEQNLAYNFLSKHFEKCYGQNENLTELARSFAARLKNG